MEARRALVPKLGRRRLPQVIIAIITVQSEAEERLGRDRVVLHGSGMLRRVQPAKRANLISSRVQALTVRARAGRGDKVGEYLSVEHVLAGAVLLVEQLQVSLRQLHCLMLMLIVLLSLLLVLMHGHIILLL